MEITKAFRGTTFSRRTAFVIALLTALILGAGVLAASGQVNAKAGDGVELTYTKWFSPAFPHMVGVVGGDIEGAFSGTVLDISTPGDKRFTYLTAHYNVVANDPSKSFSAMIVGRQDNQKLTAVLSGYVSAGYLAGDRVLAQYRVFSCAQSANGRCFTGTIRLSGGAESDGSDQRD
jgi:hypothetical protein